MAAGTAAGAGAGTAAGAGAGTAARPRPPRRGGTAARRREAATGFAFVAPNLLVFAAFMFLPLALTFVESLRDSSGFGPAEWVGLENFRTMAEDPCSAGPC